MTDHVIYGLVDPRTDEIRYVGYSSDIARRYPEHLKYHHKHQHHTYKVRWIKKLQSLGLQPELTIICDYESADDLPQAEKMWIANYRILGCNLTNGSDGGDGFAAGVVFSAEHKARISAGKMGYKFSAEARKKMSDSHMGHGPPTNGFRKGNKSMRRKFSDDQVRAIRSDTRAHKFIAADYNCCLRTISAIKNCYYYTEVL